MGSLSRRERGWFSLSLREGRILSLLERKGAAGVPVDPTAQPEKEPEGEAQQRAFHAFKRYSRRWLSTDLSTDSSTKVRQPATVWCAFPQAERVRRQEMPTRLCRCESLSPIPCGAVFPAGCGY